ncbi:hypothetical protein J2Y60_003739 [Arcicella sp. BE140]|uniref:hypothetical protein n=1 Tax=Arcicella sp. BE140 TaxID=2817847 RepID=UPI002864465D|nr:hypothetical protein [Arcicella sp. BE140]MDR6563789.1 hypothetical protein [Arcicella sp. BE51]MDR6813527.1 hypothetical protein [Arcicella sp. BE140]MDR6824840.1 hypothetical protein [Arcicella sp. BE139]
MNFQCYFAFKKSPVIKQFLAVFAMLLPILRGLTGKKWIGSIFSFKQTYKLYAEMEPQPL